MDTVRLCRFHEWSYLGRGNGLVFPREDTRYTYLNEEGDTTIFSFHGSFQQFVRDFPTTYFDDTSGLLGIELYICNDTILGCELNYSELPEPKPMNINLPRKDVFKVRDPLASVMQFTMPLKQFNIYSIHADKEVGTPITMQIVSRSLLIYDPRHTISDGQIDQEKKKNWQDAEWLQRGWLYVYLKEDWPHD
ncbi:MAG: hypothetical protein EOP56_08110 [Sphingobacteriales bacterium]|nr:MAG: hypothetical protein EOP56_08110 [Sphingobacteriales bacterium]